MSIVYGTAYFPTQADAWLYYAAQYNCSMVDIAPTVELKRLDGEIHIGEPPLVDEWSDERFLQRDLGGSRRWFVRSEQ